MGAAVHRLVHRAITMDGTCRLIFASFGVLLMLSTSGTGEHGVGVGKTQYLVEELGDGTVELMKIVKRAVDPLNLFNPGKVSYSCCL